MADNKESFLLYRDLIHTVQKLPKEKAGELFMHILEYVNDLHPEPNDLIIELAFEPIKQKLKRDLRKWDDKIDKRSDAGMKSAGKKSFDKWLKQAIEKGINKISSDDHLFEAGYCHKRMRESHGDFMFYHYQYAVEWHKQMATKSTSVESVENDLTKSTVNDNDNDNDNDNVNVNDNVILLEKETKDIIMEKTKRFIPPTYQEVFNYCRERNNKVDSQRFIDHYTSNGWMVGKTKMKDWKASVRTWEKNNLNTTANGPTAKQPIDWAERDKRFIEGVMGTGQSDTGSEGSNDQPFTSYQDVD